MLPSKKIEACIFMLAFGPPYTHGSWTMAKQFGTEIEVLLGTC
jgi:hypothetical protein